MLRRIKTDVYLPPFLKRWFEVGGEKIYSQVGFVLLGLFALGALFVLLVFFPTRPRLASLLLSSLGIAVLFPASVFISIWLVLISGIGWDRLINWTTDLIARHGLLLAVLVSFLAIMISIKFVFFGLTHSLDELAYLFQAKTYLLGRIVMPVPPAAEAFDSGFQIMNWIWTTKYLWGHPVLLAIGMYVGSPYVATVFMAMCSLPLLYLIGVRTGTRTEATVAVLLMGTSPWFWFVSATLLSHVSMLFLLLLFIYGWLRLEESPCGLLGAALGLCLGWAFTVRPLTAVCFASPFVLVAVANAWKEPRKRLWTVVGLFSGWSTMIGTVMLYDALVTGDPLTLPFTYYAPSEHLGFGERASGIFGPINAVVNLTKSVFLINIWLFGWPISLLPAVAFVWGHIIHRLKKGSGYARRINAFDNWSRWDTLWIGIILSMCCGYFFFCWSLTLRTMPLYYYELLTPLCLLSAKGIVGFNQFVSRMGSPWQRFVPVFCMVSFLASVVFFVPIRGAHLRDWFKGFTVPLEIYLGDQLGDQWRDKRALFFVEIREPDLPPRPLPWPSPDLNDQMLFVPLRDDETNKAAIRAFADRTPFLMKSCDRQLRPQYIKSLPAGDPLNDPDVKSAVRVKRFRGKIDRTDPPPMTVFLLTLLGLRHDLSGGSAGVNSKDNVPE